MTIEENCPYCGAKAILEQCPSCGDMYCGFCIGEVCPNCDEDEDNDFEN